MMILTEILHYLRQGSRTLDWRKAGTFPTDVVSLFRDAKDACRDKHAFQDTDIEEIVIFSLDLLSIPNDLTGALLAQPCTLHMLKDTFDAVSKSNELSSDQKDDIESFRGCISDVIDTWYGVLKTSSLTELGQWPTIDQSLPLHFHLIAYKEAKIPYLVKKKGFKEKPDVFPPAMYVAFGFLFHKKLKDRINQYTNQQTRRHMEELARSPYEFASNWARKKMGHVPGDYTPELKEDFLANYAKAGRNRQPDAEVTTGNKRQSFDWFYSDELQRKSHDFRVRRLLSGGDEPDSGDLADDVTLPKREAYEREKKFSDGKDRGKEYEPRIEVFPGAYNEGIEKKKEAWKKEILHSRFVPFPWEILPLQPHHYAFLYDVIDQEYDKSRENRAITLFYRILMHTGIEPEMLLGLIVHGEQSTEESLDLKKIDSRYYILNPNIISLEGKPSPNCAQTAEKVHIPLPDEIAKHMPSKPPDGLHIFSYQTNNGFACLTKDQVANFWTIRAPGGSTGGKKKRKKQYRTGIKLTPKGIAYGFYSLYSQLFRFDPIIACHVSGTDHRELYGPQLHYVHVDHERLEKEYLEAFREVNHSIQTLQYEYYQSGLTKKKIKSEPVKPTNKIEARKDLLGYGSSAVPKMDFLRDRMKALGDAVTNEKDNVLRRHNLYGCYTYLALGFATLLRPHDDPQLFWHHFNRHVGNITIADKETRKYREERILRLPERIKALLVRLQDGREAFAVERRKYCLSRQQSRVDKIFFEVKENGILAPFTFNTILEAFGSLNLDFDVPDNMARHFTRTRMHHRISNTYADIWAGHTRIGRNVAGIGSTTTLSDVASVCIPCINELLDDLGILELEYLP